MDRVRIKWKVNGRVSFGLRNRFTKFLSLCYMEASVKDEAFITIFSQSNYDEKRFPGNPR